MNEKITANPSSTAQAQRDPDPARAGAAGRWARWAGRVRQGWLTLFVVGIWLGVAYWGHRTDWTMPAFSRLVGRDTPTPADWCDAHGVPESQCVECDPKLLPALVDHGWCREHGVHQCPLCHPEVAQLNEPPAVSADERERVRRALSLRARPANNNRCVLYRRRIQFASIEAMEKAGVDIALVEERPLTEVVTAPGEITYDQTRLAHLSSRSVGTVWRVDKRVGDRVEANEVLALIDAVDVGQAKAQFIQAVVQLDVRSKILEGMQAAQGALARRAVQEAEASLREAKVRVHSTRQALVNLGLSLPVEDMDGLSDEELAARLQFLGLPPQLAERLDPQATTANLLPVRAPFEGVVIDCHAVVGEVVDPSDRLFEVADTRRMWLVLDLRQEDIRYVAVGQPVRLHGDGMDTPAEGTLDWLSTTVDEKTRTVKVRAELSNPDGRLRAGTFGAGQIVLREEKKAVAVPNDAVHWDGSCQVVFVRNRDFFKKDAPKVFHTRTVRLGTKDEQFTEIIAGVLPGEVVASKGSGILRASLLKNNLGAG